MATISHPNEQLTTALDGVTRRLETQERSRRRGQAGVHRRRDRVRLRDHARKAQPDRFAPRRTRFMTDSPRIAKHLKLDDDAHPEYGLATNLTPAELAGAGPVDTRSART